MARSVNVGNAHIIIDPNGLDELVEELNLRISADQKSNLLFI